MALAIDAKATASTHTAGGTGAQSLNNTNLTVGAGATGLLVAVAFNTINVFPSSVAVHWDSTGTNQLMTLISDNSSGNFNGNIHFYGLVNPTAGNKTLHLTWSSTAAVPVVLDAISFSGGVTTSVAAAFINQASTADPGTGASTTPTLSLTGASGNISVCFYDDVNSTSTNLTATSSTAWFNDSTEANTSVRGATAPSASTVTWTGAPSSTEWVMSGVDVVAGAAGSVTGTLSATTDNATLSAAGTVLVSGTLTKTTAAATVSAAGGVLVSGTLAKTTTNATLSAAGITGTGGSLVATTADAAISATGAVLVSGTLSKTTAAAALSAAATVLVGGTLSKTTAAAAISAAGLVSIAGILSRSTGDALLSAAGTVAVAGILSRTTDAATLSATGDVFSGGIITGTLAITLDDAVVFVPTLAPNQLRIIHPPTPYIPSPLPLMNGGLGPYAQREYDKIHRTLGTVLLLLPQEANEAPRVLMSGMVRLSRAPWWPVAGQTQDAWVYYDGPTQTWQFYT